MEHRFQWRMLFPGLNSHTARARSRESKLQSNCESPFFSLLFFFCIFPFLVHRLPASYIVFVFFSLLHFPFNELAHTRAWAPRGRRTRFVSLVHYKCIILFFPSPPPSHSSLSYYHDEKWGSLAAGAAQAASSQA